jgi:hypothetical protein
VYRADFERLFRSDRRTWCYEARSDDLWACQDDLGAWDEAALASQLDLNRHWLELEIEQLKTRLASIEKGFVQRKMEDEPAGG